VEDKEDVRYPYSYKKGGKTAENEKAIKKLRTIAKEVIITMGKKLLSGNFNLTTVSFPIKAMVPKSVLENVAFSSNWVKVLVNLIASYYPLYLNIALKEKDPLHRFKMYIVATISYSWTQQTFAKPVYSHKSVIIE